MFVHAIVLTDHSDEVVSRIKGKYPKCYSVNENCFDGRLRAVETRLARMETDMKHMPTRPGF